MAKRPDCCTSRKTVRTQWFENVGDVTIPTTTAVPPNDNQQNTEQTKVVCHYCKNQATLLESVVKGWKRNRSKEMIPRSKTKNLWHLNHLHPVLVTNEKNHPPENVAVFPMPLKDPNDSSRITQQTIEVMGKNKET